MSTALARLSAVVLVLLGALCHADYPFRNTSLPWHDRVDDLVQRLTVEEITSQMAMGGHPPWQPAPAIPRLGISAFKWNGECERGANGVPNATAFPQGIGLAASFSPSLIEQVMTVVSMEWRAYYNSVSKKTPPEIGLNCYSTTFNIMRDPRWGRCQETFGEDPYLTGHLGESYVRGVQGTHPKYFRVGIGAKHFDAYGGPDDKPISRMNFDAKVSERDLRTTFLPAFRRILAAGAAGIMCTYTSLNGIPTCANQWLLTEVLRNEWQYLGYTVSDAGAVYGVRTHHNYTHNDVDTAAACVNAGLNLEDGTDQTGLKPPYLSIAAAVKAGKITENTLRRKARPLFYTRMRFGEFDPPEDNPYNDIPLSVIGQRDHLALAVEAAMKSFVLLKNDQNILPLKSTPYDRIAVVGPLANNIVELFGNYHSDIVPSYCSTPLDGLKKISNNVQYASGCDNDVCENYNSGAVTQAVKGAEIIFLCLGAGPSVSEEGNDRTNLKLPGKQSQLLNDAIQNRNGAPIILLLFNGGPIDLSLADSSPDVAAILDCFLPAQASGEAIRRVLIKEGPGSVPAGRSPYTWPLSESDLPSILNYSMTGRTYRYPSQAENLYPFGYGLSYSTFLYSNLTVPANVEAGGYINGQVMVKNTGRFDADEVVQIYVSWQNPTVPTPALQLVSFGRLTVPQGEQLLYEFTIAADQIGVWHDDRGWVVENGQINVFAGGQQPNQARNVGSNVLVAEVQIITTTNLGKF